MVSRLHRLHKVVGLACSRRPSFAERFRSQECRRFLLGASGLVASVTCAASQTQLSECASIYNLPTKAVFEPIVSNASEMDLESSKWKKELHKTYKGYEISISSAPSIVKDNSGRRYRTDIWVSQGLVSFTPEQVLEKIVNVEERPKWDANLTHAEFLYRTDEMDVVMYRTRSAAGGIISSREFIDARLQIRQNNDCVLAITRWDHQVAPSHEKGMLRAFNAPGLCSRIICDEDGSMRIKMWGQSELGGWIPTKVLDSTVADAHFRFALTLLQILGIS